MEYRRVESGHGQTAQIVMKEFKNVQEVFSYTKKQ